MRTTRSLTVFPGSLSFMGGGGGFRWGMGDLPSDHVTYSMMHLMSTPPPPRWTEWVAHACKNMTFATLRER